MTYEKKYHDDVPSEQWVSKVYVSRCGSEDCFVRWKTSKGDTVCLSILEFITSFKECSGLYIILVISKYFPVLSTFCTGG